MVDMLDINISMSGLRGGKTCIPHLKRFKKRGAARSPDSLNGGAYFFIKESRL